MSEVNKTVRGPLGALNAVTPTYRYRHLQASQPTLLTILYTGTAWAGTMALQVSDPDQNSWVTVTSGSFTANVVFPYTPYGDCDLRWCCTAYTSGTAIGAIISAA